MLLANVALARLLGAAQYGLYVAALAAIVLMTVPSAFGCPMLVIRLVAGYRAQQKWQLMRGLLTAARRFVMVTSVTFCVLAFALLLSEKSALPPAKWWTYIASLPLLMLMVLASVYAATLRGLGRVVQGQLSESVIVPVSMLILIAMGYLSGTTFDSILAFVIREFGTLAGLLILMRLANRATPAEVRHARPEYIYKAWFRPLPPLVLAGGMSVLISQVDVLMLSALTDSATTGVYQTAVRGAELAAYSLVVSNFVLQPSFARLYASGDFGKLQRVITLGARGAFVLSIPVAFVMIVFSRQLMGGLFGAEFERGGLCLIILALGQVVSAASGSPEQVLNMTGHERQVLVGFAAGVIANVILNFTLIPLWGMNGAALSSVFGLLAMKVVNGWALRTTLGLHSTIIYSKKSAVV
jgi:O-antigen/teichoic acid export membrane protein